MASPSSLQTLFDDLAAGALLLTVNDRLARHLRERYESHQASAGALAWPTPQILPLGAWLRQCHTRLLDTGHAQLPVLTPFQERQLWERVVRRSDATPTLLQPAAAARSAMEAYRLLQEWPLHDPAALTETPEGEALLAWIGQFERHCQAHAGLPGARLITAITQAFTARQLVPPARLWIAGFDTRSPALEQLLATLRDSGSMVQEIPLDPVAGCAVAVCADDPDHEAELAARWVCACLQERPEARIAIVCPELKQHRERLRQALTDALDAQRLTPGAPARTPLFNMSLGRPLADQPLVRDALLALTLSLSHSDPDGITQAELAQLLQSPYLGGGERERHGRAGCDVQLRKRGLPRYSLARLWHQLSTVPPHRPLPCPDLVERIGKVRDRVAALPAQADAAIWAAYFRDLLARWGWPGERPLDSTEFQQQEALHRLLAELAGLTRVSGPVGAGLALRKLQQLAGESIFQAEGSDAPVQVLGVLEAAGQQFDHLWLFGLTNSCWPPAAAPNPLIPTRLQRARDMPHASAERELEFARQMMDRLAAAAPQRICSYPAHGGDSPVEPSPLIAHLPRIDPATLALAAPRTPDAFAATQPLSDWQAPAAPETLQGGTGLIADQAVCPFRALAHHRLAARALETPSHGVDARMLGNQVHAILERLWALLGDQDALLAQATDALEGQVRALVAEVVSAASRERPDLYSPAFQAIEQQRLTRLILRWLDTERERAPFRVLYRERRSAVALGPLTLDVQADRVDLLADGRAVIIDYKTGRGQRTSTWTDPRPEEPQVPLYAISQPAPAAGVVIGRVRNDKDQGFRGVAEEADLLPGVKAFVGTDAIADWAALQDHWRQSLTRLAEEVAAGRADPTPSPRACAYCDLAALCRVALMPTDAAEANDDD